MKIKITILSFLLIGGIHAQNNLGVNQPNPTAKTHITNTENQNSLQVDDEANDATPFVVDSIGNVGVQTETPTVGLDVNTTDAIGVPAGTTAQRPAVASVGDMRYNTVLGGMEFYNGAEWLSIMPIGSMQMYGGVVANVPNGWLVCDGSEVSRTTYAQLYLSIGNAFGAGDGATTFHLPDLRGRFPRGTDNGTGNDPDAATRVVSNVGGSSGDNVGSLQNDQFKIHKHSLGDAGRADWDGNGYAGRQRVSHGGSGINTSNTGGSETRPKNVNVNFIIKY